MKKRLDDGARLLSRRDLLVGVGGATGLLIAGRLVAGAPLRMRPLATDPFTLGVASGDPLPDGVVLWTRLAPDPLHGGGMTPEPVPVTWQIATDDDMKKIVASGTATATPELGHSVHVEATGLQPDRWYWYRFATGGFESPIGRTRTAPKTGTPLSTIDFAFVSCQNYQDGHFTPYAHLAKEEIGLVVHLGDYIYEGGINREATRQHNSAEVATLDAYRNRYAQYKMDPNLRAAHAAFPWIVTWDDHEVENNYAGLIRANQSPPGDFSRRRAAAYQAYYEHQPLRRTSLPKGPDLLLYRRLRFGDLAEFFVLDTRQYRTDQPCGDGRQTGCKERLDAKNTLPGLPQEKWLLDGLDTASTRWNVIAQQVFMAQRDFTSGPEQSFSMDGWDGYVASRDRILGHIARRKPSNPVVLTGDVHANWVNDLKADFNEPKSATIGTEFVGTSIASGGDGSDTTRGGETVLSENPHIKFFNSQRGYVRCRITKDRWTSDYKVVEAVSKPESAIKTRASFVVENGKAGAVRA